MLCAFQSLTNLEPIHIGHEYIQQNNIRFLPLKQFEHMLPMLDGKYFKTQHLPSSLSVDEEWSDRHQPPAPLTNRPFPEPAQRLLLSCQMAVVSPTT